MRRDELLVSRCIGKVYGKRVLLSSAGWRHYLKPSGQPDADLYVKVGCACGQVDEVRWRRLKAGKANSCKRCARVNNRN